MAAHIPPRVPPHFLSLHRVVLDTNVILSTLVFASPRLSPLRYAWQGGQLLPIVSRATTHELITALAYPKFALAHDEIQELLTAYLPYCETISAPKTRANLPVCRDPHDQEFLILAAAAKADAIVTGDKDILTLRRKVSFEILTPAECVARIANG